jgi:pyridoxal phosphate enzyme (YggS family)
MERGTEAPQDIAANLAAVHRRVAAAAWRAGRKPEEIRLVAVTKGQPPEIVRRAYAAGVRDFGENRLEEALPKIGALADLAETDGIRWHMIGHIQSRKAGLVSPAFALIHSVDRLKIARLLDRHAGGIGRRVPVLLECNVSGEASKEGWVLSERAGWESVVADVREVVGLTNLEVRGLMAMAPWASDPEQVRPVFRRLRDVRDYLAARLPGDWSELSMGMTDDFEVAVEEGATCVRIGRAIFGERGQAA